MNDTRFELALLADRSIETWHTLDEILGRAAGEEPLPNVRLDDATLVFETGGRDRMPTHWVLGELRSLASQFDRCVERLQAHQVGIVRSAVDDRPEVAYFLFEPAPHDDGHAAVSVFSPPPDLGFLYPNTGRGLALYDYVENHLTEITEREPDGDHEFVNVKIEHRTLVSSMALEAERARRVIDVLNATSDTV